VPLALLQYKTDRSLKEIAENLAKELPAIIAPNLTVSNRERHNGQVTTDDIIVWVVEGGKADVNSKDLEIIIWAHDFPERSANLEERKDTIIKGILEFLRDYDRNVSGYVWVLLQPTAFGQL